MACSCGQWNEEKSADEASTEQRDFKGRLEARGNEETRRRQIFSPYYVPHAQVSFDICLALVCSGIDITRSARTVGVSSSVDSL